jgi:rhodanese-related sulfurtransferase
MMFRAAAVACSVARVSSNVRLPFQTVKGTNVNIMSGAKPEFRRLLLTLPFVGAMLYLLSDFKRPSFNVIEVDIAQAKALISAGALIVDVREKEQFEYRHIPGALLIPLAMLRVAVPTAIAHAKDKAVLVYCGDGVTHGPEGTSILNKAGFAQAVNLKPGIEGWGAAGLPVKTGSA